MKNIFTIYPVHKGIGAFVLCGLLGLVWGFTSVPIVAGFSSVILGMMVFPHQASWWEVGFPVVLALVASLRLVHKIIISVPEDADEMRVTQSAIDAIYGTIGFALFYLVACGALVSFVRNAAPL